jgi:hypothetical protein
MTEVVNFIDSNRIFRLFEEKFVLREDMENLIHMGDMRFLSFTIDENNIKEY